MAWTEIVNLRTPTAKTWRDDGTGRLRREHVLKTVQHYEGEIDSGAYTAEVDFTPWHVTAGGRDLYRVAVAGWHYALGRDVEGIFAGVDGVVGFGGRQGAHWLKFRLARVGYLHWPTRDWDDIGDDPTYERDDLIHEVDVLSIGPEGTQATLNVGSTATWANIWNTPGGGALDVSWRIEGRHLKEEITVNQAAREWLAVNRPPSTPLDETWFGFVFRLDVSDIPRWVKAGILQDIDGDFTDDEGNIEIRDALDRLLGFMPLSTAFSEPYQVGTSGEGEPIFAQDRIRLRKRIWLDGDGNHYLLIGAQVDRLNQMHEGAITFDPTFDSETAGADKDTYLNADSQAENLGNAVTLAIHGTGEPFNENALIYWDVSSIPGDATCDSATMTLTRNGRAGSTATTVYVKEIMPANDGWGEGDGGDPGGAGEATWDYQDHGNTTAWAGSEGCATSATDFLAAELGSFLVSNGAGGPQPNDAIDVTLVTADVEDWFGVSNENYGMCFHATGGYERDVHSSEAATAGYRPKLVIEYTTGGVTYSFTAAVQSALKMVSAVTAAGQGALSMVSAVAAALQAALKEAVAGTAAGRAALRGVSSATAAVGGVLAEAYAKTAAFAASLAESVAGTASYQAALGMAVGAAQAFGSALKEVAAFTTATQAVLAEAVAKTAAAAAYLAAAGQATASVNAVLRMTTSGIAAVAAGLQHIVSTVSTFAAALRESVANSTAWQSVLRMTTSITAGVQASLSEQWTGSAAVQAALKMVSAFAAAGSAALAEAQSATAAGYAALSEIVGMTAAAAARLVDVGAGGVAAFTAALRELVAGTAAGRAVVRGVASVTAAASSYLASLVSAAASLRAALKATTAQTVATSAYLSRAVVTADMVLFARPMTASTKARPVSAELFQRTLASEVPNR